MTTVVQVCADDILEAPEFARLIAEYAAESKIEGLPPPNPRPEAYRHLEKLGFLHTFASLEGQELTGFIAMMTPPSLHYNVPLSVIESVFVCAAHRGVAGILLLEATLAKARELGSPGLLVSVPMGSRVPELLVKMGFSQSSRIFFKRLCDA